MIDIPPDPPPQTAEAKNGKQHEVGNQSIRKRLAQLIGESGEGYAAISRLIDRNPAYIQQFIKRGIPRRLAEGDRRILARHFGVAEAELGGPPADPATIPAGAAGAAGDTVTIPFLRGDRAPGLVMDRRMIDRLIGTHGNLAALDIDGDSMAPTLIAGDRILIDRADNRTARDGIYVIGDEGGLLVKRLSVHPVTRRVSILADNPAYPNFPDCDPQAITLVGRVVWVARLLG